MSEKFPKETIEIINKQKILKKVCAKNLLVKFNSIYSLKSIGWCARGTKPVN